MQRSVSNRGLLNVEKDARSKTWKEGRKEGKREREGGLHQRLQSFYSGVAPRRVASTLSIAFRFLPDEGRRRSGPRVALPSSLL